MEGKNVLITGASKRIGKSLALSLAKEGFNILIHYNKSEEEALRLKEDISKYGVKTSIFKADLTKLEDIYKLIDFALNQFKGIDILINNASVYFETPLDNVNEEILDLFYSIHIKAPFFLSKELGKRMYKNRYGRIINIIDYSPLRPYKNFAPYIITKGGLLTLTKVFAKEYAPYVLVNGILPGPIIPADGIDNKLKPLEKTILKKWGGEEEIVKAVKYLIETNFTTGAFIPVEGGRLIC
ncbi:MAG: short-chain dehydrogenase [Persephonella sp.]|nr:MAG: short-chain dehydrogenase [Persephonella sp.]